MVIDFNLIQQEYATCLMDTSRVYMIEHYLKTYDATQAQDVCFKLFPRQKELCQTLGSANNVVTTKARQMGITTTTGAFISCEMALSQKEKPITTLCIGNNLDLAQQMLFKIRDFLLQFPAWLFGDDELLAQCEDITQPPSQKILFKKCNDKEIVLFNGSKVVARSSGPNASRGVGGVTWLIFDEAAFIEKGRDVYTSAVPTVSTGGHIVMISTPNGKDALYYETCKRAKHKGTSDWNNFELIEMKWYQDPRYNKNMHWVRKNEGGEFEFIYEETIDKEGNINWNPERWEKLIKEGWKPISPWYTKMCQQFNNDSMKIAQELDVSFLGSANNVVAPQFIEMQEQLNVKEPDKNLKDPLMEDTWFWKAPIEGHRYIMSIDASRGDADDRSALEMIDMDAVDEDGNPIVEQVMEYHGKITGDDLGELAYRYGMLYGEAFTVVDCIGGTGDACILTMRRLGYNNFYYDDPKLSKYMLEHEASRLGKDENDRLPGFHTSSVRFQMLSSFANLVKTNGFKIRSLRVTNELDTWIYKGTQARMDHMDGFHDDTLTCLAMGLFVMEFSFNAIERKRKNDLANIMAFIASNNRVNTTPNNKKQEAPSKKYMLPFVTTGNGNNRNGNNPYNWLFKK